MRNLFLKDKEKVVAAEGTKETLESTLVIFINPDRSEKDGVYKVLCKLMAIGGGMSSPFDLRFNQDAD